ncbi:MAG: glycosyltransferase [Puniceicoccales bacterium]|jgi:galactofuranosylgalactofuranosylrhamnosyl-N-acetylglucosaminyl-diphospho-decaprenol beta-1,5/1,6-galactofuranosyltransferase|nr:glycosyltransferase [Puniceicoccales bacterium]
MKLAVITCTLSEEALAASELLRVFSRFHAANAPFLTPLLVVSQGVRFDWTHDEKTRIFRQENFGGAGGFTRGILEAKKLGATHVLLLDDDAIPDEKSLKKTLDYYMKNEDKMTALHGTMFSNNEPDKIFMAGTWVDEKTFKIKGRLSGYKVANENLEDDPVLWENMEIDYGAWFFFAYPLKVVDKVGLPLPLFIQNDDLEYGIRLKKAGIPTLPLPGLRVWHPEFGTHQKRWYVFFSFRNRLIEKAVHTNLSTIAIGAELTKKFFYRFLAFQYDEANYITEAIHAYLKGPENLKKNPSQDVLMAKSIIEKWPISFSSADTTKHKRFDAPKDIPLWREILRALLLNGFFFPKKENLLPVFERGAFKWTEVNECRKYGLVSKNEKEIKIYEFFRRKLCGLALAFIWVLFLFFLKNYFVKKQWKSQFPLLTSEPFWREYLSE